MKIAITCPIVDQDKGPGLHIIILGIQPITTRTSPILLADLLDEKIELCSN